jgi:patched 1 protein
MVQLMGEKDLFDYWSDTYKVHSLDWSKEKAKEIIGQWQKKFGEEVERVVEEERLHRRSVQ